MAVPTTPEGVLELRRERGFVTPMPPVEAGYPWCVWCSRGSWEFAMHPDDAARHVEFGLAADGVRMNCWVIEEWPLMGALLVGCVDPAQNAAFTPSVRLDLLGDEYQEPGNHQQDNRGTNPHPGGDECSPQDDPPS